MSHRLPLLIVLVACNGGEGASSDPQSDAATDPRSDAGAESMDAGPPDLPESCPCPTGSFCDLATNRCELGCLADPDCMADSYCDTAARTCLLGCRDDDGCAADEICVAHQCVGCVTTADCEPGETCTQDQCVDTCSQLTCTDPPQPACGGSGVRRYAEQGTCAIGACSYTFTETACPGGCTAGWCDSGWFALSTTGAPSARSGHTAVWTGTEMIVWGGQTSTTGFADGGRYDPATNTWSAMSTTNAPSQRFAHTAVWTGTEMIVWGGYGVAGALANGGRYNPSTNTWTALSSTGAPTRRSSHTAVWTGTQMIVWGGYGDTGNLGDGSRFDPVTNTWMAMTPTSAADKRYRHSAVWTGTEMIIWGGQRDNTYLGDGRAYTPSTDTWSATPLPTTNAPEPRASHSAVWANNRMYVWGGIRASVANQNSYLDDGGSLGSSWTTLSSSPNTPAPRSDHTAVWTGTEMIVWGGYGGPIMQTALRNDGGRFVP